MDIWLVNFKYLQITETQLFTKNKFLYYFIGIFCVDNYNKQLPS